MSATPRSDLRKCWKSAEDSYDPTVHLLFLDESGQISERKLFALEYCAFVSECMAPTSQTAAS